MINLSGINIGGMPHGGVTPSPTPSGGGVFVATEETSFRELVEATDGGKKPWFFRGGEGDLGTDVLIPGLYVVAMEYEGMLYGSAVGCRCVGTGYYMVSCSGNDDEFQWYLEQEDGIDPDDVYNEIRRSWASGTEWISSNTLYVWNVNNDNVSLTISYDDNRYEDEDDDEYGTEIAKEYHIIMTFGENVPPIIWPEGLTFVVPPIFEPNKRYEVSMMDNVGIVAEV